MALAAIDDKQKDDEEQQIEQPDHAAPLRADVLGSIAGSDPSSPGYLGKINSLITAHGALDKLNPFGQQAQPMAGPQMSGQPAAAQAPVMAQPQHRSWLGKIGHGLARAGNIAGELVAPGPMAMIPGTDLNKRVTAEKATNTKRLNDTAASEDELRAAQAEEAKARTGLATAQTAQVGKAKEGLTPEETTIHDLMTGDNGNPRVNPATQKPYSYLDAYKAVQDAKQAAKPEKTPNDFEQFYVDWLKDHNYPDTSHNRLVARKEYAAAGQAPQHDPRQLAIGPDRTVLELRPGVKVPEGTKSVSGDLRGPTADEQKRSDLAQNLNENLDQLEDIVTRRPELFGKVHGRMTKFREWVGSDDPDVATLKGIEDRLGMVSQSSHGMRSAEHVAESANAVMNAYKNGPDAMKKAIAAARQSAQTFLDNTGSPARAERPGNAPKAAPAASPGLKVGQEVKLKNGATITIKHVYPDGSFD